MIKALLILYATMTNGNVLGQVLEGFDSLEACQAAIPQYDFGRDGRLECQAVRYAERKRR